MSKQPDFLGLFRFSKEIRIFYFRISVYRDFCIFGGGFLAISREWKELLEICWCQNNRFFWAADDFRQSKLALKWPIMPEFPSVWHPLDIHQLLRGVCIPQNGYYLEKGGGGRGHFWSKKFHCRFFRILKRYFLVVNFGKKCPKSTLKHLKGALSRLVTGDNCPSHPPRGV